MDCYTNCSSLNTSSCMLLDETETALGSKVMSNKQVDIKTLFNFLSTNKVFYDEDGCFEENIYLGINNKYLHYLQVRLNFVEHCQIVFWPATPLWINFASAINWIFTEEKISYQGLIDCMLLCLYHLHLTVNMRHMDYQNIPNAVCQDDCSSDNGCWRGRDPSKLSKHFRVVKVKKEDFYILSTKQQVFK